ncbi:facilitated trehalose transporter Tret1-like isoform X2 [Periplaneta americana]|uniref:facilitated trehalose transporter Tret1-like isoform X2 n=1 Tax=Periplaneta americana TaxID=6978 RepID=UPI0037E9529A
MQSSYDEIVFISVSGLVCVSGGMALGHSAVLLPELQSSNSSIVVDEETGSWIASVYSFTTPIGCLFGGVAMDVWGRKRACIIFTLLMVLGWTVIAGSQDITMLLVARIIEGFSRGAALTILSVYGDELVSPKLRGTILTGNACFVSLGIMVISVLSAMVDWRTGSGIAAGVSAISLFSTALIPESPMWLVRKKRMTAAERSLQWLCGPGRYLEVKEELLELQKRLCIPSENVIGNKITSKDRISQSVHLVRQFLKPNILKPFLISHFFNTIQCICGLNLFTYYSIDILSKLRRNSSHGPDDVIANIILSVVRLAATLLTAVLLIWVGRRPVGIVSGLGSFFFATALGILITVQASENRYPISDAIESWLNFSIVLLFFVFISLGFFVLPAIMIGELQHSTTRSYVCGYIYTTNDLILGAVIKEYPSLSNNLGMNGLFFLFGSSCLVCTVFIILFLPETKDRTLFEIEDYFKQDNVLWLNRKKATCTPSYASTVDLVDG